MITALLLAVGWQDSFLQQVRVERPQHEWARTAPLREGARQSAAWRDRQAVAMADGLFERVGSGAWQRLDPAAGKRSWSPRDVRAVAYGAKGELWFASAQGLGRRGLPGGQRIGLVGVVGVIAALNKSQNFLGCHGWFSFAVSATNLIYLLFHEHSSFHAGDVAIFCQLI